MSKLIIRKIKRDELLESMQLILRSANDLRMKAGRKPWDGTFSEVPPFNYHLYDTDSDGQWGAFFEGKMVGYSASVVREKQWYLAYLFVEPKFQLKGVGRKLLERAWAYGKDEVESHALCTFPYNETALALYSSFGMMPTHPIFEMYKKIEKQSPVRATALIVEEDSARKSILRMNKLDKEIRGYPHLADIEFFAGDPKTKIYQFYHGTDWIGYSIINSGKLIAPAGATRPEYLPDILTESFRICLKGGVDFCRVWIGGPNAAAYKRAISLGFKIGELAVFLSTKPYSDLYRYLPAHLAIF
jgi:ribosomal protein S18 acetylase RimI-like enzyme